MNINFPKGTLYDSEGNEIIVPEECSIVYGESQTTFVKTSDYAATFVYRPPNYPRSIPLVTPIEIDNEEN